MCLIGLAGHIMVDELKFIIGRGSDFRIVGAFLTLPWIANKLVKGCE